jgi:hypothetical protein
MSCQIDARKLQKQRQQQKTNCHTASAEIATRAVALKLEELHGRRVNQLQLMVGNPMDRQFKANTRRDEDTILKCFYDEDRWVC